MQDLAWALLSLRRLLLLERRDRFLFLDHRFGHGFPVTEHLLPHYLFLNLGASWVPLGPSCGRLGASWGHLLLDFHGKKVVAFRHGILDTILQSILVRFCIPKSIPKA